MILSVLKAPKFACSMSLGGDFFIKKWLSSAYRLLWVETLQSQRNTTSLVQFGSFLA